MLDGYHILTLTHRDAPLQALSQAIVPEDAANILPALKDHFEWKELYYLATCNRVMYLFYDANPVGDAFKTDLLEKLHPELSEAQRVSIASRMRLLHGADAIRHLLEVASSMDSLVIGEREIIRQLRTAYDWNHEIGLCGDHIRLLMRYTIETAKLVYSNTAIGEKSLSVVALAFQAMERAGARPDARVLLVGAGETNTLYGRFLCKYGYKNIAVFNRSLENAQILAEKTGGTAFSLDQLADYRAGFDIIVVCTASNTPVITPEIYAGLLQGDTTRKIVVDLSIPHNIDLLVPASFHVQYIEIENLRTQASEHRKQREAACQAAAVLIGERVFAYRDLWHERQVERALSHIPEEVRAVKEKAIHSVFAKDFEALDPAAQATVLKMLDYMEKKCVAIPIKAAKAAALRNKRKDSPAIPEPKQASV